MINGFNSFSEEYLLESLINESIIYFSPKFRDQLKRIDSDISKRMLGSEGSNIPRLDATFFDVDDDGNVTFITMRNAMKILRGRYPDYKVKIDEISDIDMADYLFQSDDTGIYKNSRNSIKIGKLVNAILGGSVRPDELEKFVNSFKASSLESIDKIRLVSGDEIKFWYEHSKGRGGSLGQSCMSGRDRKLFNIYSENPDSCNLLVMTIDDELVARALVWKIHTIKGKGIDRNNKPEFFLDRVYSVEDYQIFRVINWAKKKGWAVKMTNTSDPNKITWNGRGYNVKMAVKIKKSNYGDLFPYMDTFSRYENENGLLWNDDRWNMGGKILRNVDGSYRKGAPRILSYINRFKEFIKGNR